MNSFLNQSLLVSFSLLPVYLAKNFILSYTYPAPQVLRDPHFPRFSQCSPFVLLRHVLVQAPQIRWKICFQSLFNTISQSVAKDHFPKFNGLSLMITFSQSLMGYCRIIPCMHYSEILHSFSRFFVISLDFNFTVRHSFGLHCSHLLFNVFFHKKYIQKCMLKLEVLTSSKVFFTSTYLPQPTPALCETWAVQDSPTPSAAGT